MNAVQLWVVLGEGQWCSGIRVECDTAVMASRLVESLSRFGVECRIVEKQACPNCGTTNGQHSISCAYWRPAK